MTKFTIQCLYASYYENTRVVDAESVEEACSKAIEEANQNSCWRSLDDVGDTFVSIAVEGAHESCYEPGLAQLELPLRYTEKGQWYS